MKYLSLKRVKKEQFLCSPFSVNLGIFIIFQQIDKHEVFLPLSYIYQFDRSILNAVWNDVNESKEEIAKDVDTASVTYFRVCQGICIGKQRTNSAYIHIKIT